MILSELKEATQNMAFVKIFYGQRRYIITTAPLEYASDSTGTAPRVFCAFFIGLSGFPVINAWVYVSDATSVTKINEKEYRKISDTLKFYGYVYNKKTKKVYKRGSKTSVCGKDINLLTWR